MKMNEKQNALYDAVSGIDAALVQEATAPRPAQVKRTLWRVAAAAAVVAILIGAMTGIPFDLFGHEDYVTAPGLLSIRAYALDEIQISEVNSTVLEKGVELPWEYIWSPAINVVCNGLPITFNFPADAFDAENISLEISCTGGSFVDDRVERFDPVTKRPAGYEPYLGNDFSISNNDTIYWINYSKKYVPIKNQYEFDAEAPRTSYVDIIIRADKNIVGYAVIKIYEHLPEGVEWRDDVCYGYLSQVVEIVSFPLVNGRFQRVTAEYVQDQMKAIKDGDE